MASHKIIGHLINHCCSICGTHMDTLCEHLRYTPTPAQEIRDMAVIHKSQLEKPEPNDAGKPALDNFVPQDVWDAIGKGVVATTKKFFPFKKPLSESTRLTKSGPTLFGNICAVCATPISIGCVHLSAKVTVEEKYDISYVWEPAEPCPSGTNGVGYYSGIHGVSGTVQPKSKFDFTPRVGSPCPYCANGRYHAGEYCQDIGRTLGITWTPCETCKDDPFHLDGICGSTGSPGCSGEGISGVLGSPIYTGDDGCQGAMGIPGHYMDNITTCNFCDAIITKATICCNSTHREGKRFRDVCWCGDPHLDGSMCGTPGPMGPAVFLEAEDGVSGIPGPIGPVGPTYTSEDGCQGVMGPCGGPIGWCNAECPSINCEPYCDHFKEIGKECPRGPEGTPGPAGVLPCSAVCPSSYCTPGCQYKPKPMSYSGVAELKLDTCPLCNKVIVKGAVCCGSIKEDWVPRKGRFDTPGRKWLPPAKKRITCGTSLIGAGPNALANRQERQESTHPPLKKETNDFIHPRTAVYIKASIKLPVDDMEEPP